MDGGKLRGCHKAFFAIVGDAWREILTNGSGWAEIKKALLRALCRVVGGLFYSFRI